MSSAGASQEQRSIRQRGLGMNRGYRARIAITRACLAGLAGIAVVISAWLYLASTRGDGGSGRLDKSIQMNSAESIQENRTELLRQRRSSSTEKPHRSSGGTGDGSGRGIDPDHAQGVGGGLVFIKSFKTGSTTLATYIAQIGHQNGAYFLHPRSTGWFAKGELESRRDQGETFDISLRHVTPYTPYSVLEALVPRAVFATIMRDPVERFMSLFNFRGELQRKFRVSTGVEAVPDWVRDIYSAGLVELGRVVADANPTSTQGSNTIPLHTPLHPQALVAAIRAGKLPLSDARPFCNQLAWLMSGEDVDFTRIDQNEEATRVAKEVIDVAEKWNVTVLITERMSESVAVLADRMGWRMDKLELRVSSQRVQRHDRESHFYSCDDHVDAACVNAIRGCNLVDGLLYEHFKAKFDALVQRLPSPDLASRILDDMPPAKSSMSRLELGMFPVNCIHKAPGEDDVYTLLHSCDGRPA